MPEPEGPWTRPPPPTPRKRLRLTSWRRLAINVAVLVAIGLAVWGLATLFPGRLSTGDQAADLARWAMLVVIVAAGLARLQFSAGELARNIAIWVAIIAVLMLGYSFRGELGAAATRVRSEFSPGYPVQSAAHELVVTQSDDGAFYVIGQVNGSPVRFLVDTGASDIVLSPADAQRLGVDVASLRYTGAAETANGVGHGADYQASSLAVGPIRLTDVSMQINQAPMSSSLLGMAFFKRLDSFQVKDGKLYLRWTGG